MRLTHVMVAGLALAACEEPGTRGPGDQSRGPGDLQQPSGADQEAGAPGAPSGAADEGEAMSCQAVVDPLSGSSRPVERLVAVVEGTRAHPEIHGQVNFTADGDTVTVRSSVDGLPAGPHGHHVHLYGDCVAPERDSAGPHFDFERLAAEGTGAGNAGGQATSPITGDLGNLQGAGAKAATAERTIRGLSLADPRVFLGRAVVIHTGPNDPSKGPDGGAGEPIACGVIGIAGEGAVEGTPANTSPER